MPTREVRISVVLDGLQDASNSAKGFAGDVASVGAAASEATAKAAPLGDAIDKAGASLKSAGVAAYELTGTLGEKLRPAAESAFAAFERMGNVTGIRGLSMGIVQAQVAMQGFKTAVDAATASGEKLSPQVGFAMKAMGAEITAATQKLGMLKAAQAEVGVQAQAMGQSWKQAAASGGSLTAMFTNLAESSSGAGASMVKFGISAIGVFEALKLGINIGKEVNAVAEETRKAVGGETSALGGLVKILGDTGIAGAGFKKWANEAAKAANYFADELEPVIFKVNNLMKVHQAAAAQLLVDEEALKKLGVAWESVGHETATTAQEIKLIDDALHRASLAGQDQVKTIELNSKALQTLKQRLEDEGVSLDSLSPRLRTTLLLVEGLATAHDKHALALKTLREASEKLSPGLTKVLETLRTEDEAALKSGHSVLALAKDHDEAVLAIVNLGKSLGLNTEETVKYIAEQTRLRDAMKDATAEGVVKMEDALKKYGVSLEDVAKKTETLAQATARLATEAAAANAEFDKSVASIKARNAAIDESVEGDRKLAMTIAVHAQALRGLTTDIQDGIAAEGQATIMNLTLAAATDTQNKALEALLQTQNLYTESLQATLGVAKGWKDYLAELLSSYQSGALGLLAYKTALTDFLRQLETQFAGASGAAKKSLQEVIDMIQKLIETAGAGPAPSQDFTPGGALNRLIP